MKGQKDRCHIDTESLSPDYPEVDPRNAPGESPELAKTTGSQGQSMVYAADSTLVSITRMLVLTGLVTI